MTDEAKNKMDLTCFNSQGAFYVFPSVKKFVMTGEEFAERLLLKAKVAVVPGSAFGDSGKYYLRICYACSMVKLKNALNRIENFLTKIRGINV